MSRKAVCTPRGKRTVTDQSHNSDDSRLTDRGRRRLTKVIILSIILLLLLLFFFAFGLLNRSIDRWFGEPARQIVDDARAIEESYFKKEEADLVGSAGGIARGLASGRPRDYESREFKSTLDQEMADHDLALVRIVFPGGRETIHRGEKQIEPEIEETLTAAEQHVRAGAESFSGSDEGDSPTAIFVIAAVRLSDGANDPQVLIVSREFPPELTQRAATISSQHENFHSMLGKIKRIKAIYILLLAAVTLLLIFSASWLALYVARGITVPIQALAEATERVAHGDFVHPVEVMAEDELAVLGESFNQMAAKLAGKPERLPKTARNPPPPQLAFDQ